MTDHAQEARDYAEAAQAQVAQHDPTLPHIAIAHALLAVVDELRAIRETLTPKPVVTITRTPCQCVTGADEPWA